MILDYLFKQHYHVEKVHQIALARLLEKREFAHELLGIEAVKEVTLEPANGIFDILVHSHNKDIYLELKCGSTMSYLRIKRQNAYFKHHRGRCVYVVLGSSSLMYRERDIKKISNRTEGRISFDEIIFALEKCFEYWPSESIHYRFAIEYLAVMKSYQKYIQVGVRNGPKMDEYKQLYHFELYQRIKEAHPDIPMVIQVANNDGSKNLMTLDWKYNTWKSVNFGKYDLQLYFEFVNTALKFKFTPGSTLQDEEEMFKIRTSVLTACHVAFDERIGVPLTDSGRTGQYMSVCMATIDYGEGYNLDQINSVLPVAYAGLEEWKNQLELEAP